MKFKVGDRVKIVNVTGCFNNTFGTIAEVLSDRDNGIFLVKSDKAKHPMIFSAKKLRSMEVKSDNEFSEMWDKLDDE